MFVDGSSDFARVVVVLIPSTHPTTMLHSTLEPHRFKALCPFSSVDIAHVTPKFLYGISCPARDAGLSKFLLVLSLSRDWNSRGCLVEF